MREVLFRAKRKHKPSEWAKGFYREEKDLDGVTRSYIGCYEIDKATLGQFTGITDANKRTIFEGDILYTKYEDTQEEKGYFEVYNEVVFKNGAFGLVGETTGDFLSFDYLPIDHEVVCGNIYDNKDLIE